MTIRRRIGRRRAPRRPPAAGLAGDRSATSRIRSKPGTASGMRNWGKTESGKTSAASFQSRHPSRQTCESGVTRPSASHARITSRSAGPYCPPDGGRTYQTASGASLRAKGSAAEPPGTGTAGGSTVVGCASGEGPAEGSPGATGAVGTPSEAAGATRELDPAASPIGDGANGLCGKGGGNSVSASNSSHVGATAVGLTDAAGAGASLAPWP